MAARSNTGFVPHSPLSSHVVAEAMTARARDLETPLRRATSSSVGGTPARISRARQSSTRNEAQLGIALARASASCGTWSILAGRERPDSEIFKVKVNGNADRCKASCGRCGRCGQRSRLLVDEVVEAEPFEQCEQLP